MSFYTGKVVWITGASSGIGEALASQLAAQGARLILTARNVAAMSGIQERCLQSGAKCIVLPADLSRIENLECLTRQALVAFGHIDILINNAGVTQRSLASETDLTIDRQIMELDYFAPVALTKLLLPHFTQMGSGHIVAISSMAGLMGFPQRSAYAAAKHAMKGFFETLQTESKLDGMHITLVYPGRIHTPISLSALTADGTAHGKMDEGQLNGIPVEKCAAQILDAVRRKKRRVIIARGERLLWWFWFFLPALYYRIARKHGTAK